MFQELQRIWERSVLKHSSKLFGLPDIFTDGPKGSTKGFCSEVSELRTHSTQAEVPGKDDVTCRRTFRHQEIYR